jgi:hypothetical protein
LRRLKSPRQLGLRNLKLKIRKRRAKVNKKRRKKKKKGSKKKKRKPKLLQRLRQKILKMSGNIRLSNQHLLKNFCSLKDCQCITLM